MALLSGNKAIIIMTSNWQHARMGTNILLFIVAYQCQRKYSANILISLFSFDFRINRT